ncbi:MAG: hypothetical protein K2O67_06680 [Clostridia bacterium]|nr:hypothetical protein [Clostridia bacterium]
MIFYALFGGLPTALICLVTALLHECGHVFCAAKMGFKCETVKIMPYGAAAVCDVEGIRAADEIKLALAGPFVNAAICVFLAGLWWFVPETYAYTDTVLHANLAMLAVNLLPAYPLDGGRVAGCILSKIFSRRAAFIVLKVIAVLCSAGLAVAFFFSGYNPTLLFFALFLICSAIEKAPAAKLINFSSQGRLNRGIEVKYVICDRSVTFKDAFKKLDEGKYLVLQLYDDGGVADEITQDELYELATEKSFYDSVFEEDYFSRNERLNSSEEMSPEITALTHAVPIETASSTAPESDLKS